MAVRTKKGAAATEGNTFNGGTTKTARLVIALINFKVELVLTL